MARPKIPRRIDCHPPESCFKPNGVPMSQLARVELAPDELEALRLVDQRLPAAACCIANTGITANLSQSGQSGAF